jgi:hypothetical protein
MQLADILPVLQSAIGPVILLSGVGLMVGTMNNRLGRTIDRCRLLVETRNRTTDAAQLNRQKVQLDILWRRAHILRTAITLAINCVLLIAVLIIVVFTSALLKWENVAIVIALFIAALMSLIASLVYFIRDVNMSLHALEIECDPNRA